MILYTAAFNVSCEIASGKNEEDGDLVLNVSMRVIGPAPWSNVLSIKRSRRFHHLDSNCDS